MLFYYNAIIMKKGSHSIVCAGAFTIHHDSALFQKAGTTGFRTGSLFCFVVLYLSPGAPLEFPPSYLVPQLHPYLTSTSLFHAFGVPLSFQILAVYIFL